MDKNSNLRDRIAAALFRGDAKYACSLIELHNEDLEQEIRAKVHSELCAKRDREMQLAKLATVYFKTKDGLMVADRIKPDGDWPPIWQRPCQSSVAFVSGDEKSQMNVRTYRLSRQRAENGAPIYDECDN